jgi:chromosome segregation ATPase
MKHALITIAALFLLLPFLRAEDPSEIARQRNEEIARESQDLKDTDAQIAEFESNLAKEEKSSLDLQAAETKLTTAGNQLASDGHDMMARDKAYGIEVKQQIAECPKNTTDAALAQRCDDWKAKLDGEQKGLKLVRKEWMARKDEFLGARTKLDEDKAANKKAIEHYKYSIPNMKIQRDRLLHDLWQVNDDVKNCQAAIKGSTLEHMHAVCGQMWDGNKMYPEFSPEPGGGKKP